MLRSFSPPVLLSHILHVRGHTHSAVHSWDTSMWGLDCSWQMGQRSAEPPPQSFGQATTKEKSIKRGTVSSAARHKESRLHNLTRSCEENNCGRENVLNGHRVKCNSFYRGLCHSVTRLPQRKNDEAHRCADLRFHGTLLLWMMGILLGMGQTERDWNKAAMIRPLKVNYLPTTLMIEL